MKHLTADLDLPARPATAFDATLREDRCKCRKPRGEYGRGPWHLRRCPGQECYPAADLVTTRCPAWTEFATQFKIWKGKKDVIEKAVKELLEQRLKPEDERARLGKLYSEQADARVQIEHYKAKLAELSGRTLPDEPPRLV